MTFLTILVSCIAFVAIVWCLFQVSRWWLGRPSGSDGLSAPRTSLDDAFKLDAQSGPVLDVSGGQHTPFQGHYLATACDLAYLPEAEARVRFRDELNLDARLISVDNTQVYVCQNAESIVVAFRGSEIPGSIDGFKDWLLTNARNFLVIPEGRLGTDFAAAGVGARFHRGFMEALAEVWNPLHQAVDEAMRFRERPLWITGHSLGGAIALMAAWRLHQHFIPVHQICTFGAPMVGNAKAAEAYAKEFPGKIVRYVDFNDMVPKLPTMSLFSNQYNHVQRELVLGEQEDADAVRLAGPAIASPDGPISQSVADEVWGNVQSRIASHLMGNYLAQINRQLS
ncbi:lipase family protein [Planctomycetes bacterium K23_9]|uniref:Lipase (Class 3) n=1 Tax=Stieleria marina TaxID=1930275 RepID=A0A517NRB5_9BACT|nr:Lipase (class 3) [Planctomycetes bacterium K23_9]